MRRRVAYVALGLGVLALVLVVAPIWPALRVSHDDGVIAYLRPPDGTVTLSYVHSIDRLPIEEDLQVRDGELVVRATRMRQFGAGMGQIAGEGHGYADGRWWVIDDLDRPVGTELLVRVGPAQIDHRLRAGDVEVTLSGCWPGQRVRVEPARISLATAWLDTVHLHLGAGCVDRLSGPARPGAQEGERR